jgi:hypothetical protein
VAPGHQRLQLDGGAFGDDLPAVEEGDAVGEGVGLLQVLGGEEDGDAAADQFTDVVPDLAAAAGIEARRRLVEEDQLGASQQGHGQVEAAAHAPRVGRRRLVRRLGEAEAAEQLGDAGGCLALGDVVQVGHQHEVLGAGEQVVERRELAGDADGGPHRDGIGGQVVAGDGDLAGVGGQQGREQVDGRGLARPVRSQQGEDRPRRHVEVDAVEHHVLPEGLAQPPHGDG